MLAVVYLVFTEGYAPAGGERLVRGELCAEAIRLGRLVTELRPDDSEAAALLALMLLQHARRDARALDGRLVRLAEQDRGRWHRDEIAEGLALLGRARGDGRSGPYLLQASIAAAHASARAAGPDWRVVAALYERLERLQPSPAVRLNRAVAVAEAYGPEAGLALLDDLDTGLGHQLPATRAELLARLGRTGDAAAAYDRAVELAGNAVVRAHLAQRRATLGG